MKKVCKPSYAINKNKKKSSAGKDAQVKIKEKIVSFAIGEEVLACWQDGLHYLAVIKAVRKNELNFNISSEPSWNLKFLFNFFKIIVPEFRIRV